MLDETTLTEQWYALWTAVVERATRDAEQGDGMAADWLGELRSNITPTQTIPRRREERSATTRWEIQESEAAERMRRLRMR